VGAMPDSGTSEVGDAESEAGRSEAWQEHARVARKYKVGFLPGVNIDSNPLCGQAPDGRPLDCGDSEWLV
jgi:hypothetical protein